MKPAIHLDFRWGVAIAVLWILMSMVRGLQLAMSVLRLRRIANQAMPVEAGDAWKNLLSRRLVDTSNFAPHPMWIARSVIGSCRPASSSPALC